MGVHQALMRGTLFLLVFTALIASAASTSARSSPPAKSGQDTAVLTYIYSPECSACQLFDREVGAIYDRTHESLALPIERVLIDDWQASRHELVRCALTDVISTPTFIQIHDCQELDRITGFSNAELFWLGVRRMLSRLTTSD